MSRTLSHLLRRFPLLMRMPYQLYSRVQARYTIGVAAVIFNADGRVLLVEHAYHPRYPWGLPGGWINVNEEPAAAVVRELREELQLNARAVRVIHSAKSAPNHIDLAFLCEALSPIGKLSHELLDYQWVPRNQLPDVKRFHLKSIETAFETITGSDKWERV